MVCTYMAHEAAVMATPVLDIAPRHLTNSTAEVQAQKLTLVR